MSPIELIPATAGWTGVIAVLLIVFLATVLLGPLRTANAIKTLLEQIAHASGWLLIVLMVVTCMDIIFRRLQLPIALTQFQEFEWHLSTAVFSAWMGYNYTINAHPRVDSYTDSFSFRTKAWIELVCIVTMALPFLAVMLYHGWPFIVTSFLQNEVSENVTGLSHRWIIKGIFIAGVWLVLFGVLSVMLRLIAYLFGGATQEEAGVDIGHSEMEA